MRIVALFLILALAVPVIALAASPFAGDWAGKLDVGAPLRLVVHLVDNNGAWSGNMDSLDQGASGIPFSSVTVDGNQLHFEIQEIGGVFEGTLSDDGTTIAGTWSQSGMALPLKLARGDASSMPAPKRPQEPKPPFPYHAEDVTFTGPGGITLAGTFTRPDRAGTFPAVLLVSGSGPEDRDETVFNHKPFLVLSDYLTRRGFAVLRVDDRGVGESTGDYATATTEDFAQDALAGVAFLKSRKDVDRAHIGVIGHSEGGIIAPIVATRSKDVAFIVLMAGVGVPMENLLARQSQDIMKANGVAPIAIEMNAKTVHRMSQIAMSDADSTVMREQLQTAADSLASEFAAIDPTTAEVARQSIQQGVEIMSTPWMRYLLRLDPQAALRNVRVPVLAINGSLDLQVSPDENLAAIDKALRGGGNRNVTIRELPDLNHLFQTAKTGAPSEYATIEETMAPVAMQTIADWLAEQTGLKKQ